MTPLPTISTSVPYTLTLAQVALNFRNSEPSSTSVSMCGVVDHNSGCNFSLQFFWRFTEMEANLSTSEDSHKLECFQL